jgi:general L-amino acid transport system substrate-binding protein
LGTKTDAVVEIRFAMMMMKWRESKTSLTGCRAFLRRALAALFFVACHASVAAASTLVDVTARGKLNCGVNLGLPGFSASDAEGNWSGFDVDFCRAVAAAIFGDPDKVVFFPLSTSDRFEALTSGKIDVLARNSTWTMQREAGLGLTFVGVTYYDGQGFMLPKSRGAFSSRELNNSTICVQTATTSAANLADYFAANNMTYEEVVTADAAESLTAYQEGRCDVITSDISQLYAQRLELPDQNEHLILPDTISKEPLGPAVRQDDPGWATLVKWVLFALIDAEELGVDSDTLDEALASEKPAIRRLVGNEGTFGEDIGLSKSWAADMLKLVGNYGEIYDRNLGAGSSLGIPRGLNQLWSLGGIQYAPPIR